MKAFFRELFRTGIYKRTQGRITRQVTFAAMAVALAVGLWQLSLSMVAWDPGFRSKICAQHAGAVRYTADGGRVFVTVVDAQGKELERHPVPDAATRNVEEEEAVTADTELCRWRPAWIAASFRFGVPGVLLLLGWWIAYRIVNVPVFADFLVAVEAEMNKVSWPTRSELFRASVVVLFTIFALATLLAVYDTAWRVLFTKVLRIL